MKYFLGENYVVDESVNKILITYKDFLTINRGFIESKKNTDIILPENVNTEDAISYKEKIELVLESGDLSKLLEYRNLIFK